VSAEEMLADVALEFAIIITVRAFEARLEAAFVLQMPC